MENEAALRNWIHINPNVKQFIGSQYLPGRNLACKLLYFEGKLLRAACAERVNYIMSKVAPSGITGNTSFGRLLNEPDLVDTASQVMDRLFDNAGALNMAFLQWILRRMEAGSRILQRSMYGTSLFRYALRRVVQLFAEDTVRLLHKIKALNISIKDTILSRT